MRKISLNLLAPNLFGELNFAFRMRPWKNRSDDIIRGATKRIMLG